MRDAKTPFAEHVDGFLAAKTLAPKSKIDYRRYLLEYDKYTGHTSLKVALTLENASAWVEEEVKPRGLHAARNACMALKSMATWVARVKYIQIPGGGSILAGLEAPRVPKSRRQPFTDDQMDRIFAVLAERPNKDRLRATAYVRLLVASGLRRNEARQLALRDVHLETEPNRQSYVRVLSSTSKGMTEGITRIDREAVRAIDEYVATARHAYWGPGNVPEPLFTTEEGFTFTEHGFGSWADRIADDIDRAFGAPPRPKHKKGEPRRDPVRHIWSSHLMRHTWATNYNRGMQFTGNNVYDLMREGRWGNPQIPLTYTKNRPEDELLVMKTPAEALREHRAKSAI